MATSVIIPAYGDKGLLNALLMRLHTYCENSIDEIVIVENGGHYYPSDIHNKEKWLHLPQNLGFGPAVNFGVARSVGQIIVVISTDVEFEEDVIGIANQAIDPDSYAGPLVGGKLWNTDTGWNRFGDKLFPYIEGWFFACSRNAWDRVEGISPEFYPYDYEDIDLSTKFMYFQEIEFKTLRHLGGRTIGYNPEREAITKEHREIFKKKWVNHD